MRILVAGASGALGRLIVRELEARGHAVRSTVRRVRAVAGTPGREVHVVDALRPGAWSGVCTGMDAVVSTIGASVNPSPLVGFRPYTAVDAPANLALLEEARRAGVRRFVYVSLVGGNASRHTNYSEGHERVVDALAAGTPPATVLRPTGFFCAMADMIPLARKGVVPVFGDGTCRTNPIDERDLAAHAALAAESSTPGLTQIELGGPETFTRDRVAQMAFEAIGKRPRLLHVPVGLANFGAACLTPFNPRAAHFVRFAAYVMSHDAWRRRWGRGGWRSISGRGPRARSAGERPLRLSACRSSGSTAPPSATGPRSTTSSPARWASPRSTGGTSTRGLTA